MAKTEHQIKDAHALALCQDMEAISKRITEAEPDPYYGGVPDIYSQIRNALNYNAGQLRERFNLGPAEAATEPPAT